jgi:hypothetical protein
MEKPLDSPVNPLPPGPGSPPIPPPDPPPQPAIPLLRDVARRVHARMAASTWEPPTEIKVAMLVRSAIEDVKRSCTEG